MEDDEVKYPDVTVHLSTGTDGNIGAAMARVSRALQEGGVPEPEISKFRTGIFMSESYDAALRHIMRTVNVT